MEKIIKQIQSAYPRDIVEIIPVGKAEINVMLTTQTNVESFSQEMQDHLLGTIDPMTILKINLVDQHGMIKDSFSTNQ